MYTKNSFYTKLLFLFEGVKYSRSNKKHYILSKLFHMFFTSYKIIVNIIVHVLATVRYNLHP